MSERRYQEVPSRSQVMLLPPCLDDYVSEHNAVRAIDAFVGTLDLQALGFAHAEANCGAGQPAFDPALLLKLYLYGYQHRVRSSRRLEAETPRSRRPAHAGATDPRLARRARPRPGSDLPPEARTRPARPVGLHPHGLSRRDRLRPAARSYALPLPAGLVGLRPCPGGARRRELHGARRRLAGRALASRRRAPRAPHRQPVGRVREGRRT